MRIWIVNQYALPPNASGGPTRHLGLARQLVERGHEVVLLASAYDHYTRERHRDLGGSAWVVERTSEVDYVWIDTPPYASTRGRAWNMVAFARRLGHAGPALPLARPDVVVGSSPHLLAADAARRIARRHAVPFVMEVRDIWPQSLIDLGMKPRHPGIVALRRLERRLYREAAHVIVVPPLATHHVVASGGSFQHTTVIPNGVALGGGVPNPPPDGRQHFTVVYAGTVGLANGLEVVVEAAAELRRRGVDGVRIRIVGAGPERAALADAATRSRVDDIVSVEGPVPSTAIPGLLDSADACLLVLRPSPVYRWGISPTKLFDYMAAARPVIGAVDAPDDPSMEADAGIRIAAADGGALADAIVRLREMRPEERAAMGARGRAYVEEHHSFEKLAERYEALLLTLVGQPPGSVE